MICDTIRELRERAGVSQAALARRVGVTRSAVNAWEMGLSIPTTQYVAELAQFFRVSADYSTRPAQSQFPGRPLSPTWKATTV